jgi:THO complex subunit 7
MFCRPTSPPDAIVLSRITNDERALRRIVKKFNTYASFAFPSAAFLPSLATSVSAISLEDARESFLVELASFNLQLKKAGMVCEAETRQVDEYQRERQRIGSWLQPRYTRTLRIEFAWLGDEHVALRRHIDQLKTSWEDAQVERRQKMEYDVFAEKINTLPSRAELEACVAFLRSTGLC